MSAIDQINQGGTTYEIVPEIAELFSIEKTYRAGDHVIYEAGWYTFKTDKYAGAWDATKVDGPFKVTNQISELKEDLTQVENKQKEEIKPYIFDIDLPIKVYRTLQGYECELPFSASDISGYTKIYVDSVNGNDSNSGDSTHPVKTLSKAEYWMEKAGQAGHSAEIIIADGSEFYYDDLPNEYNCYYSTIIRADGRAKAISGKKPSWTAVNNHYTSEAFTGLNIVGCVDMTDTDDYGLYAPMVPLTSEADVENTPNSYFVDNTNKIAYVHPKTSSSISSIVVIISNKYSARFEARNFSGDGFVYIKNLDFIGNGTSNGKSNSNQSDLIKRLIYFDSCTFQHGCSTNVIGINQYTYTYVVNCIGGYGKNDVFNYHFSYVSDPTKCIVIEVNVTGKEGGYYSGMAGTSDQISTCHEGANVFRCNTHGYNSDGSLIADANGCYSVLLDCAVINTAFSDAPGRVYAPYRFDDVSATRNGKTLMQNCYGYDNRNAKFITAVDLILNGVNYGGTIETTSLSIGEKLI